MPITLATFRRNIDATILGRGQSYYDNGHVIGLDELDANRWQAEVAGTYPYTVTIHIAADDALSWACSCPYVDGPVCKHVVATLYAIESALDPAAPRPRERRQTRTDQVREAISQLTYDQLVALLVELANGDRQIAHMLLARYSSPTGDKPAAKRLAKDALSFGRDRYGLLDYRATIEAAQSVGRLFGRANKLREAGQVNEALLLYQAILEEVVPALQEADDSSGSLSGCVEMALEELEEVGAHLSPAGRAALFGYCLSDEVAKVMAEWEWRWALLQLAGRLMTTPLQRAELFDALDRAALGDDTNSWIREHDRTQAAEIKFAVIQQQDDEAAVQAFLEAHSEQEEMRIRLAHFYLDHGNPDAARQVCQVWLDDPPAHKLGRRRDFLEVLRLIAERTGDKADVVRQTAALFLETGDMTIYQQLKEMVGPEDWRVYRPGLLARMETEGGLRLNRGAVYAAEAMWAELMAVVRSHPDKAIVWHQQLAPRYPKELSAIYKQLAGQTLDQHMNRAGYQNACAHLLRMQEVDPTGAAAVVADWRAEYKNRRALQDELTRAFGPPFG